MYAHERQQLIVFSNKIMQTCIKVNVMITSNVCDDDTYMTCDDIPCFPYVGQLITVQRLRFAKFILVQALIKNYKTKHNQKHNSDKS